MISDVCLVDFTEHDIKLISWGGGGWVCGWGMVYNQVHQPNLKVIYLVNWIMFPKIQSIESEMIKTGE